MKSAFLAGAVALALAAFTTAADAQTKSRLQKVQESGVIRVGTTGDFAPMTVRDPATNSFKGFEPDVAEVLAKDLGVKIEWVPTDWRTMIAGVTSDKFDIVMSGVSINPGRAKVVGFTEPYFAVATVPVALKANAGKYKSWDDINKPDVTVAVILGTVFHEQVKVLAPNAKVKVVEAPATGWQEVLGNRADVNITSTLDAAALVQRYDQLAIVKGPDPRNRRPFGYVTAQDDLVWLNFLNSWVQMKKYEGLFEQLEAKWAPN